MIRNTVVVLDQTLHIRDMVGPGPRQIVEALLREHGISAQVHYEYIEEFQDFGIIADVYEGCEKQAEDILKELGLPIIVHRRT